MYSTPPRRKRISGAERRVELLRRGRAVDRDLGKLQAAAALRRSHRLRPASPRRQLEHGDAAEPLAVGDERAGVFAAGDEAHLGRGPCRPGVGGALSWKEAFAWTASSPVTGRGVAAALAVVRRRAG